MPTNIRDAMTEERQRARRDPDDPVPPAEPPPFDPDEPPPGDLSIDPDAIRKKPRWDDLDLTSGEHND
jgi:hypothetical protein